MTPKPERKRPPASSGLQRGRLTAQPEQLRVGDQQHPEDQTPEVPDSQTPEDQNKAGGLWGRIAELRAGDQPPPATEPPAPAPAARPGPAPDPGSPGQPQSRTTRVPHSATHGVRDSRTSGVREPSRTESQSPRVPKSQSPEVHESAERPLPLYKTLERTEARLRADQLVDLTALRKRVAANRTDKSERITDNTLIRVAVDFLLAHGGQLEGNTEAELRASLLGEDQGE